MKSSNIIAKRILDYMYGYSTKIPKLDIFMMIKLSNHIKYMKKHAPKNISFSKEERGDLFYLDVVENAFERI